MTLQAGIVEENATENKDENWLVSGFQWILLLMR